MGYAKPLYGETELIDEISKIDEEINELAIKRALYVKKFKEQKAKV